MERSRRIGLLTFTLVALVVAIVTAAVTALLVNIHERKQEQRNPYLKFVEVDDNTVDAAQWGKNWPREYDGYLKTATPTRTKYGGGAMSEGNLPPEKAERDPWLTRMFAGYAFALDYRDRRGHAYMLQGPGGHPPHAGAPAARLLPALPCLGHAALSPEGPTGAAQCHRRRAGAGRLRGQSARWPTGMPSRP